MSAIPMEDGRKAMLIARRLRRGQSAIVAVSAILLIIGVGILLHHGVHPPGLRWAVGGLVVGVSVFCGIASTVTLIRIPRISRRMLR